MSLRHTLGGRSFLTVQDTTVEQDYHFLELIKAAGIDGLTIDAGEDAKTFSERIIGALVKDGAVLNLIGCLLVPAELVPRRRRFERFRRTPAPAQAAGWSPEVAEETARFLGKLSTPEDKAKIRSLVLTLLAHFFESGIVSLSTMQTFSDETVPSEEKTEERSRQASGTDPGLPSS